MKWLMWVFAKPKEIRPGLVSSINASYTPEEIRAMLDESGLTRPKVRTVLVGLFVTGVKSG